MRTAADQLRVLGSGFSLALAILVTPLMASSQCIEVTPMNWDYGDVEIGASVPQVFSIYSCASTDLYMFLIDITDDDTGAFSVTAAPSLPIIPGGETEYVEVTFTPPDLGAHEAFLRIVSDAPEGETYVSLVGVGIQQAPVYEGTWTSIKALYR